MRCLLLFLCFTSACTHAQPEPEPEPVAALFDPLTPLYPDTPLSEGVQHLTIHTPRNAIVSVHVNTATGAWQLVPGTSPFTIETYELLAVPVEENTGLHSRTERFENLNNPHVIRDAPFHIYEAMVPFTAFELERAEPYAWSLRLRVPGELDPGEYDLTFGVFAGQDYTSLDLTLIVHDAVLPDPGPDTLGFTNWINPNTLARYHGVEPFSDAFWPLLERTATLCAEMRQNVIPVPILRCFTLDDAGQPVLNTERMTRWVQTFDDAGLHWIELMQPAGRPDNSDWSDPNLQLRLTGEDTQSDAGRATIASMYQQLDALLSERGWSDRVLAHLADEPTDTNAAAYADLAAQVRAAMPGATIFEATMSDELVGAVDVWCPQAHRWQRQRAFFDDRRDAGDRVWVYTCLEPGGPWMNRLLDMERTRIVYLHWACALFGFDGYLHWALNHWMADPYEQSAVLHPHDRSGRNWLPAGDTHLLYPGATADEGPRRSVRSEAHRMGMEDHALLMMLMQRDPQAAREIIESVVRAFDDFDPDIDAYRAARQRLLERLDANDAT